VLEFDKVVAQLEEQTATSLGRQACLAVAPSADLATARRKQDETAEARSILDSEGTVPLGGIVDIGPYVRRASVGAMLQPADLLAVRYTLHSSNSLKSFFSRMQQRCPLLADLAGEIETFHQIENAIAAAISESAEVVDSASSALARVRGELRSIQARLMEKMHSYVTNADYRTILQEPVVTLRSDRYCIPVKSEYRTRLPGIVHDSSSSGATLFIEPTPVVEMGNRRRELLAREREEVEKILIRLSDLVGERSDSILVCLDAIGLIDCIVARARLAIAQDASKPSLNNQGRIRLKSARHPLLGEGVVPIDVELGVRFRALLITGPNTGGKTVALKTVGLLCLMAASGLQTPADPDSELPVFTNIFADIGDEQSIEQSLSTFSSHMRNIVHITKNADANTLVLMDEIGAGTDPDEGAALAKSVLDFLLDNGAKIVATTHYGELKEYAYLRDNVENACVEFDPETLRPTYRLLIGIPGSSNAFAIAARLGLNKDIVDRARAGLGDRSDVTEEFIRRIEETHRAAAEERKTAERRSADAETLRRRYEEQLTRVEGAKSRTEQKVREQAQIIIDAYSSRLDDALLELSRQQKDTKRAQSLKKKAEQLIDDMEKELVEPMAPKSTDEPLPEGSSIQPGMRVRVESLNQDAEVLEGPVDGKVLVLVGTMRVSVPVSHLRMPREVNPRRSVSDSGKSAISLRKSLDFRPEIMLRAMRAEAALIDLDKFVDDAMTVGADRLRVIHGKGTGVLRSVVWDYLKSHPGVESYKLAEREEGGAGATIVWLKK